MSKISVKIFHIQDIYNSLCQYENPYFIFAFPSESHDLFFCLQLHPTSIFAVNIKVV